MAKIPYSPNMYAKNDPVLALAKNIALVTRKYGPKGAAQLIKAAQCFGQLIPQKKVGKKNRQQRIAARARKAAKAQAVE
jgi:hypothetical protein